MHARSLLLAALIATSSLLAPAGAYAAMGILHGDGHVYALSSPPGWQLDPAAGQRRGAEALLYPLGKSWQDSEAIFAVDTDAASAGDRREGFVKGWLDELSKKIGDRLETKSASPLKTGNGSLAEVREVKGEALGHALFAFVFEEHVVVRISLTARSEKSFRSSREAFEQLVESYQFLGRSFGDVDSVPHLLRIADANAASRQGAEYDATLARHFVENHGQMLKQCISQSKSASIEPFHLLVMVGADSHADRIVAVPDNEISRCIGTDVHNTQVPLPPGPDWWVRISMGARKRSPQPSGG